MFNVKIAGFLWGENESKLKIRETFTAASKMRWLVILPISEINCKRWSKKARNMALRRILTSQGRLPHEKRN